MLKKFNKMMLVMVMLYQLCAINVPAAASTSDRVISVTPETGSVIATDCEMIVTYTEAVVAENKTVLVNGTADYVDDVIGDGNQLKITFCGLSGGTHYKVCVDDVADGNEVTVFFTTEFETEFEVFSYSGNEFADFYESTLLGKVNVTAGGLEMETVPPLRRTGAKAASSAVELEAEDIIKTYITLTSEKAITFNLYFNDDATSNSFSKDNMYSLAVEGTGTDEQFEIDMSENSNWQGTIGKFLFEQLEAVKNKVTVKSISFVSDYKPGLIIGSYDIYENYAEVDEAVVTDKTISGDNATVAINIKSMDVPKVFLVAAYYKDGKMADAKCKYVDLSSKDGVYNATIDLETEGAGYVKAFLRKSINDIASVHPAISTFVPSQSTAVGLSGTNPFALTIENDTLIADGKLNANENISIQLLTDDCVDMLDEVGENGNYADAVIYTDEFKTGADGKFRYSIPLEPSETPQDFVVMIGDSTATYPSDIYYIDSGYTGRTLQKIKSAIESGTAEDICGEIAKAYKYLDINSDGYSEFVENCSNIEDFAGRLKALGAATDIATLEKNISQASVFGLIKGSSGAALVKYAKTYESYLELKEKTVYEEIYDELSDEEKAEILEKAAEIATDFVSLANVFEETCVFYGIRFNLSANKIREILEKNNDKIGIDFDILKDVAEPDNVYLKLAGQTYDSFEKIATAFENAVDECIEDEKEIQGSTPSFGGGGGGGGGATRAQTPSFTVPAVINTPVESKPENIFNDISGHWAEKSIMSLYKDGIVSGRGDGIYAPEEFVTREEFLKMTVNAFGINNDKAAEFTDTDKNAWYYSYICKGVGAGLINGNPDGSFGVGKNITREDMAVIIFRAAENKLGGTDEISFNDSKEISDYAKTAVAALSKAGIINGKGDNNFDPKANATRAETAVIIARVTECIGG